MRNITRNLLLLRLTVFVDSGDACVERVGAGIEDERFLNSISQQS
jgi:hypothetical protein